MPIDSIILIIIGLLWLIFLLILGFLALVYHYQHTPLIEQRKIYYQEWNQIKSSIDLDKIFQESLQINFELPAQEKVYYLDIENLIYLYSQKSQEYKSLIKFETDKPNLYDNYFEDADIATLKSSYKLKKIKTKKPLYFGNIYISNFRVLIYNPQTHQTHQIPLKKIQKAYLAMINEGKTYSRGYIIQTDGELYEIVSDQPSAVLIINELLRKEQKNEQK